MALAPYLLGLLSGAVLVTLRYHYLGLRTRILQDHADQVTRIRLYRKQFEADLARFNAENEAR